MRSFDTSLWSFFAALTLSAFGLNWLWEMIQMPAYTEMVERSWAAAALPCAFAALGDVAMTLAIYGFGCLATGHWRWGVQRKWNIYLTGTLLAGLFAAALEWKFLGSGRWSYSERMPIVAIFGVGLWPLMQLTLLVPLSWFIATWWNKRASGESTPGKPDARNG